MVKLPIRRVVDANQDLFVQAGEVMLLDVAVIALEHGVIFVTLEMLRRSIDLILGFFRNPEEVNLTSALA